MKRIAIGIDLDWPFEHHYDIIRGIVDYGRENSIECITEPWLEVSKNIEKIPGNYDGIIARVTPPLATFCKKNDIPLVNVWENSPVKDIPLICRDSEMISSLMVNHFTARGFHNISFVKGVDDLSADKIADAFILQLNKRNIVVEDNTIVETVLPGNKQEWDCFNKNISSWLNKANFPIAVCTSDHLLARYIIEWCKKHDVSIPDDVAILSCSDNDLICKRLEPSISHIENKFNQIGYEATRVLHKLINGEHHQMTYKVLPGQLVEMRSTDVEPVEDRIVAKALGYIRDNTSTQIQVIDVANSINVSRRSLERRFRKFLNRSINEEILRSKMDCAQKLILNTNKTTSEIAYLTGISSGQRLSQVFRKQMGLSITEFRYKNNKRVLKTV